MTIVEDESIDEDEVTVRTVLCIMPVGVNT